METTREWRLDRDRAEFYERNFVPAIFAECADLVTETARVEPGERVLDVACGTGALARAAAARVGRAGRVTGLDINPSMLEVAGRVAPEIEWKQGDAARLPFPDGAFDAVLCQAALMFFPDRVAALEEMRRVLRPGGRLAVHVFGASPGYELVAELLEEVAGAEAAEIMRSPFSLCETPALKALFEAAGMPEASIASHLGRARFESLAAFVETEIEGWLLAGRVDPKAFLEAARRRMSAFVATDGAVRIPLENHVVLARTAD